MTRKVQILDALQRADCTSSTVARLTGMPYRTASSKLSELFYMGVADRKEIAQARKRNVTYLYSIKGAA